MSAEAKGTIAEALRQGAGLLLLAALFGFSFSAISGQGFFRRPLPAANAGGIPHITYDEALAYLKDGNAIVIDARHGYDFHLGHIPGAINLPLAELDSLDPLIATLPRSATIITYCDGQDCNSSELLASALAKKGFLHVRVFFAGWNEWVRHHNNDSSLPQ